VATSLAVHVGGVTATNIDFAHVLTDKLPLFIAIVVLLAFCSWRRCSAACSSRWSPQS